MNTYLRLLDLQMVDHSILVIKCVSEFQFNGRTNFRTVSLNVGATTFEPPCTTDAKVKSSQE